MPWCVKLSAPKNVFVLNHTPVDYFVCWSNSRHVITKVAPYYDCGNHHARSRFLKVCDKETTGITYCKPYINQGRYAGAICIIINIYDLKMPGLDEYNIERLSQIIAQLVYVSDSKYQVVDAYL